MTLNKSMVCDHTNLPPPGEWDGKSCRVCWLIVNHPNGASLTGKARKVAQDRLAEPVPEPAPRIRDTGTRVVREPKPCNCKK